MFIGRDCCWMFFSEIIFVFLDGLFENCIGDAIIFHILENGSKVGLWVLHTILKANKTHHYAASQHYDASCTYCNYSPQQTTNQSHHQLSTNAAFPKHVGPM